MLGVLTYQSLCHIRYHQARRRRHIDDYKIFVNTMPGGADTLVIVKDHSLVNMNCYNIFVIIGITILGGAHPTVPHCDITGAAAWSGDYLTTSAVEGVLPWVSPTLHSLRKPIAVADYFHIFP